MSDTGSRDVLLDTALGLFSAKGYDGIGVQEICGNAGVTKPTLYHYFASKRGLLDALLVRGGEPLVRAIEEAAAYSGDITLSLERSAFVLAARAKSDPGFYRLLLALYFAPPESEAHAASLALLARIQATFERLFLLASRDHGNMKGRQKAYAATFFGMLNTYIGIWLSGAGTIDERVMRGAVKQFMHGIFS